MQKVFQAMNKELMIIIEKAKRYWGSVTPGSNRLSNDFFLLTQVESALEELVNCHK